MRVVTRRGGFSLAELLVAIVAFGIAGGAMISVLLRQQRLHRWQAHRAQVTETLRTVQAVLTGELRDLSGPGGDLMLAQPDRLRYKAMRGVLRVCALADTAAATLVVEPLGGLRDISAERDSILVFVEGDRTTVEDDAWASADVTSIDGAGCGASAGLRLGIAGPLLARAGDIEPGAPVKYFEASELLIYQDREGDAWLGARMYQKATRTWSITQPIVGPLAQRGMRFSYLASGGEETADPRVVSRISASVIATSTEPVGLWFAASTLRDSLRVEVALRNSAH